MTSVDREIIGEGSSVPFETPNVPLGIYIDNVLKENIAKHGDARWLTDVSTGKSINYSQLVSGMKSVASGLRKRGFNTGDSLVVIGLNFIELPLMSFAVWRAGGCQACLGVNLPAEVIEMRMRELGNKFVLTDYDRASRIVHVANNLDFVKEVFVIGDKPVAGCTPFDQLLQDSGDECPENLDNVDLDSMAWLAYTSGTTGLSKGIVLTHRTIVTSLAIRKFPVVKESNLFFVNPMNNTAGLTLAIGTTLVRTEAYCMSNFSEEKLLGTIDSVKPRAISLFPAHIAWICRHPHLERYDLSSVVSVTVVGSVVNPSYERMLFDKLPNMRILDNVYGMTEVGLISRIPHTEIRQVFQLDKSQIIARHVFGSVGKVASYCKLKVVDVVTGEKLGPNQIGEICVQSPYLLKEYLNRPKETAELFRDGWVYTGDKGYYDENEYVFVTGRYKELIKYRNIHVVPTNVEKHVMTHPAVEDVAVVGLPHDIDGELPLAFVVLSATGQKTTADQLITYTNEKVMDEEKLRGGIRFVDKIPRNDSGKIVRPELLKKLKLNT